MEPNLSMIRARRAELAKYRQQIDAEDKELESAERALTRLAVAPTSAVAPAVVMSGSSQFDKAPADAVRTEDGDQTTPVTHKDLVIRTLRARAEPWVRSSCQFQSEIAEAHGIHIKDTSFLPLLSGLMGEGIIKRSEKGIALAERAQ
jgi:hypothetical protein